MWEVAEIFEIENRLRIQDTPDGKCCASCKHCDDGQCIHDDLAYTDQWGERDIAELRVNDNDVCDAWEVA